jgi:murein DD-endopeptidase MepM/ murein hydrolase activator NlpD
VVSSPFGSRTHPMTGDWQWHRGMDIAAPMGEPVRAAYSGTVVFAGWMGNHGKHVQVQHDGRWTTRYSHLSDWLVEAGDVVRKGQVIGFVGSTGLSTGPHLHFELMYGGEQVDPEAELPEPPESRPSVTAGR